MFWGGNKPEDAIYLNLVPAKNDGTRSPHPTHATA
jgi:hypothetical protein